MAETSGRREVAESGLELLLSEMVSYFMRGHGARFFTPPPPPDPSSSTALQDSNAFEMELISAKRHRIEALGHDVGTRLLERYAQDRDMLDQDLDMVKFVCKDFWEHTFKKQIDILRTNHRGLYVLTDNNFRWLRNVSSNGHDAQKVGTPEDYVVFPCGMICGALTRLGVKCRVTAELIPSSSSYKCSFNVQVIQS